MDALALLCTLHADGPSTLRALRSAGCQSLLDLRECSSNELAQFLELSVASAERLQREAELLGERLSPLEPEDSDRPRGDVDLRAVRERAERKVEEVEPEPEAPRVVQPLPPALSGSRAHRSWFSATRIPQTNFQARADFVSTSVPMSPASQDEPDAQAAQTPAAVSTAVTDPAPKEVQAAKPAVIEPVSVDREEQARGLEAARRTIEELAARVRTAPAAAEPVASELESELQEEQTLFLEPLPELSARDELLPAMEVSRERLEAAAALRAQLPEPEPVLELLGADGEVESESDEPCTPLLVGQPDGLELDLLEALNAAGIRSAEALVRASGLELSRKLSIPFTRLLELQLGAQHMFRRNNTLVPQKPRGRRATDKLPDARVSNVKLRRHTDFPRPLETRDAEFTDSFDSPSSDIVGGPFA